MNTFRNIFYATLSVSILGSCVSVSTFRITPEQQAWIDGNNQRAQSIEKKAAEIGDRAARANPERTLVQAHVQCGVYILPDAGTMPDLPTAAIKKLAPGDDKGLDDIALNNIKELRIYIRNYQDAVRRTHTKYLQNCMKNLPDIPPAQ